MKAKMFDFAQELSNRGREAADLANERTRGAMNQAAGFLADTKGPIATTARFANRLNDINHRYIKEAVELNARVLAGGVDDGVKRLKAVAGSSDVRSFYEAQADLFPATRDRIAGEFRSGVNLVRSTASEVKDLVVTAIDGFRGKQPVKKTAAKAKAKPAAKKTTAEKKPAAEKKATSAVSKQSEPAAAKKSGAPAAKNSSAAA